MAQALTETTRVTPPCGAPAPNASVSRGLIVQGILAWLPALFILIGMPILALTTTKLALLPSMKRAFAPEAAPAGGPLFVASVPLNNAAAKSAHSGFRSIGLIGIDSTLKVEVDQNKAKLMAVAASDLSGKTVSDLDKPGQLDALRARLKADFNRTLGRPVIKELYIALWPNS